MPETRIRVPIRKTRARVSVQASRVPIGRAASLCCLLAGLFAGASITASPALAASATKLVAYHGFRLRVPRAWPVFNLARDPRVCVRFNRHAVYLGEPSASQSCPADPAGRTEAILISPLTGAQHALPSVSLKRAASIEGSQAQVIEPKAGVAVTATWASRPALIARALRVRSLAALAADSRLRPAPSPLIGREHRAALTRQRADMANAAATPGAVYAGSGFDACSAPSSSAMSAWRSAYGALGVYIGGANMACSQPNLTASWVSAQSAAGWHLIPIYVGLQAPGNSCGCAAISSSDAAADGAAAAEDAVLHAQALGLGTGNPIYYDMEAYDPGGGRSATVLAFLAAWTARLHALGYLAGVYSSDSSGIADLVSQYGSGYQEPDEIWFAAWNGQASTSDPTIPNSYWANQQRLHQYAGAHNETHGGVTINVDGDYLDAATAATGSVASTAASPPAASGAPRISGIVAVGQTLSEQHATWSGQPTSYAYQWQRCDSTGASCTAIAGASAPSYKITAADVGATLRVLETAANAAGSGAPAVSAPSPIVVSPSTGGYLLYSAYGNVYNSTAAGWFGSPAASGAALSTIRGLARTADGQGYWLVDASGQVYAYGDAASKPQIRPAHPVIGIVGVPGGYLLYTAYGNVYNSAGASWYGSPYAAGLRISDITGLTPTADGRGYWLVDASGHVYAYGDAASKPQIRPAHPVIGIVGVPGGYLLYTAYGNVYNSAGASWYGSPFAARVRLSDVTGLAATADGKGYWLVESDGRVTPYGDAAAEGATAPAHPILGVTQAP